MKKLFIKILIYSVLILLLLESLVRIFHLTKDYPDRYVDQYGVEKWVPNQSGYSVTGIRRQNVSEYHINNFGYNSYREFKPTKDKIEIALVGDSFIEGFHQNYNNSIGKKIEKRLPSVEVYEYGYAGYDLADQLHLINKYKETFDLIDYVILGLKFDNDLTRSRYEILEKRMKLESPLYRSLRQIKLLVYLQHIGAFDSARELTRKILSIGKNNNSLKNEDSNDFQNKRNLEYIENFKKLVKTYGFNKTRFMFLLDKENTPEIFIDYLNTNNYAYIDYSEAFKKAKRSTTLIYDMHWNNLGRKIIADLISQKIKKLMTNY